MAPRGGPRVPPDAYEATGVTCSSVSTTSHAARKVVGVGSVGTRAWIVLMLGHDDADPLFLQFKEAQASVLEPRLGKSKFAQPGQRVVEGQRLMQAASDIMLGWIRTTGIDGLRARLLEMYQNSAGETGAGRTNKSCPGRRRESRDGEAPTQKCYAMRQQFAW